jgi:Uma2 family endonuclease
MSLAEFEIRRLTVDEFMRLVAVGVVPGPMARWDNAHPTGEDAALVVEIARTKVSRARAKSATYAAGGVREYWIVDVEGRLVEVLTAPDRTQREYRMSRIVRDGESIEIAGQPIAVATLLPTRR